ncbi:LRR receptor-like kinase family protein [Medicago truncatula]|nr:LRR receptor-like kinase family protein [Medicago truncatula]
MWMLFFPTCGLIVGTQSTPTVTSQLQMEANAILNSGWWNVYDARFIIRDRCNWKAITCNEAGSIIAIDISNDDYEEVAWGNEFQTRNLSNLNLSCFNNLETLVIWSVKLHGTIPKEIGHLSKLTHLDLSGNYLKGELPPELWLLKNLTFLYLSYNRFKGEIPSSLGNLKQLQELDISHNNIQGSIPLELGFLKNLTILDLSYNRFKGEIPSSLGNLKQLQQLNISHNNIQGSIPHELRFLKILSTLDLSHNRLNGNLPIFLSNLTQLEYLDISHNFLIGSLPSNRFPYNNNLLSMDLSHNLISGQIPSYIDYIYNLNLSNNNLTGTIPQSLCDVNYVDISYNCLEGPIPNCPGLYTTNSENYDVCPFNQFQPWSPHKKNNKLKHIVVIVIPILIILVIVFLLLVCLNRHHDSSEKLHGNSTKTKNGDMFCIWNYDGKIAYDDIIKATEDFDMRYCIGTGAYGSVYKAQLPCGKVVALKKLHGYEAEVPSFDESFRNEVRILSEIKHRHIVKLYGFCLHKRIMFLIYQYMERGSLFSVLYDDVEAVEFKWRKRVNTVKGVAFALSYLHHDCTAPIVH